MSRIRTHVNVEHAVVKGAAHNAVDIFPGAFKYADRKCPVSWGQSARNARIQRLVAALRGPSFEVIGGI
jgi:hypothetical protein